MRRHRRSRWRRPARPTWRRWRRSSPPAGKGPGHSRRRGHPDSCPSIPSTILTSYRVLQARSLSRIIGKPSIRVGEARESVAGEARGAGAGAGAGRTGCGSGRGRCSPGESGVLTLIGTLDRPAGRETYRRGSIPGKRAVGCTRATAGTVVPRLARLDPRVAPRPGWTGPPDRPRPCLRAGHGPSGLPRGRGGAGPLAGPGAGRNGASGWFRRWLTYLVVAALSAAAGVGATRAVQPHRARQAAAGMPAPPRNGRAR